MSYARRAISVLASGISAMRSMRGPYLPEYAFPIDVPAVFRWALGSLLTDDGWTTIASTGAGAAGMWLRVREDIKGADLTADASQALTVGGKQWRKIPASTLTQNIVLTLDTTNAAAGDWLLVSRFDTGSYTAGFLNGGPGAGTIATMPVSSRAWVLSYFNGTDWEQMASGLML